MPLGASASAAAAHEADPDHVTIVLKNSVDDVLEFRCAHPFVVSFEKDPGLTAIDGTPPNPFGWNVPQSSQPVSDYHAVRGRAREKLRGNDPEVLQVYRVE
jgi:hypothetical protein